jgi:hypothetical protein
MMDPHYTIEWSESRSTPTGSPPAGVITLSGKSVQGIQFGSGANSQYIKADSAEGRQITALAREHHAALAREHHASVSAAQDTRCSVEVIGGAQLGFLLDLNDCGATVETGRGYADCSNGWLALEAKCRVRCPAGTLPEGLQEIECDTAQASLGFRKCGPPQACPIGLPYGVTFASQEHSCVSGEIEFGATCDVKCPDGQQPREIQSFHCSTSGQEFAAECKAYNPAAQRRHDVDMCGHTCNQVVSMPGVMCERTTWAEGCGQAPPPQNTPPAGFQDSSKIMDLCPEECNSLFDSTYLWTPGGVQYLESEPQLYHMLSSPKQNTKVNARQKEILKSHGMFTQAMWQGVIIDEDALG